MKAILFNFFFVLLFQGCTLLKGDCFPDIQITLNLNKPLENKFSIIVVAESKILNEDEIPVDKNGIPNRLNKQVGIIFQIKKPELGKKSFVVNDRATGYPTWYYAFIDRNNNKVLDIGEEYGVYSDNPRTDRCRKYSFSIDFNRIRI
jgi:hypothetical protein